MVSNPAVLRLQGAGQDGPGTEGTRANRGSGAGRKEGGGELEVAPKLISLSPTVVISKAD